MIAGYKGGSDYDDQVAVTYNRIHGPALPAEHSGQLWAFKVQNG